MLQKWYNQKINLGLCLVRFGNYKVALPVRGLLTPHFTAVTHLHEAFQRDF